MDIQAEKEQQNIIKSKLELIKSAKDVGLQDMLRENYNQAMGL